MPDNRNRSGENRPERPDEIGGSRRERVQGSSEDRERIRRRAYERYQERGAENGRDQEDWYEAERENRERSSE